MALQSPGCEEKSGFVKMEVFLRALTVTCGAQALRKYLNLIVIRRNDIVFCNIIQIPITDGELHA